MDVSLENKLENNDETTTMSEEKKNDASLSINSSSNNNNNANANTNHSNHHNHNSLNSFEGKANNNNNANDALIPQTTHYKQPLTHQQNVEYWKTLKKATINGKKVDLVPYTRNHVATYNKWLSDPYIQSMTNSEPYSLNQEFEYQKEWEEDEEKYIFIILDIENKRSMAGDINLFIRDDQCELNVMIAEEKSRRKGLAFETLQLTIVWAQKHLDICKFYAKIQSDNKASIALFKKLKFVRSDYADAFKEFTYTLDLSKSK